MEDYKLRDLRASHTLLKLQKSGQFPDEPGYYESIKRELKIRPKDSVVHWYHIRRVRSVVKSGHNFTTVCSGTDLLFVPKGKTHDCVWVRSMELRTDAAGGRSVMTICGIKAPLMKEKHSKSIALRAVLMCRSPVRNAPFSLAVSLQLVLFSRRRICIVSSHCRTITSFALWLDVERISSKQYQRQGVSGWM